MEHNNWNGFIEGKWKNEINIPTTIRQVVIPTLNDDIGKICKLNEIISKYKCVDKAELLPFKKICETKYESLNIEFSFKNYEEASKKLIEKLSEGISISKKY